MGKDKEIFSLIDYLISFKVYLLLGKEEKIIDPDYGICSRYGNDLLHQVQNFSRLR